MEPIDITEKFPYITQEYLESTLRKEQFDSSITIKEFSVTPALAKGENYSSDILRVKISYVTGSKNHRYVIALSINID